MKRIFVFTLTLALASVSFGQSWTKENQTDQLRGTTSVVFRLEGKFLTPPSKSAPDAQPAMIADCTPGSFGWGKLHGKMLRGYIYVGHTVVDVGGYTSRAIEFRLDDGKVQRAAVEPSTDSSSIFYDHLVFTNFLYGHMMFHKENTTPPVRKIVISVPEYVGGAIVMQFDMPDPTEVADTCGLILHKRGE
jgi:hypothetical protein